MITVRSNYFDMEFKDKSAGAVVIPEIEKRKERQIKKNIRTSRVQ